MKLKVQKDRLTIEENEKVLNSGSVNYYEIECEFDGSWNGLTKEAIVIKKDEKKGISIAVINDKIFIDKEKNGLYAIGFVGYNIENDEKVYQISTNLQNVCFNKGAGELETTNSQEVPTPTEWEIYIAQIQEMIDSIGTDINYNNLQNKPKINNVELLGNKSLHELGIQAEGEYYTKPNDGIPKTDLSSEVQTSLGKADTAIQEHQDISMKQNIEDNSLDTNNKTIPTAINEVNSIAKGANQALSYGNYSTMVTAFNALGDDVYNVGQNVMIVTLEVPDLWISGIESTSVPYVYVDDATIVSALQTDGYIQVGYYKLSMLETQKVDLTNYVKDTDYASNSKGGVFKPNTVYGTGVNNSTGYLYAIVKNYNEYVNATTSLFISKGTLENVITGKDLTTKAYVDGLVGNLEDILEELDIGGGV